MVNAIGKRRSGAGKNIELIQTIRQLKGTGFGLLPGTHNQLLGLGMLLFPHDGVLESI